MINLSKKAADRFRVDWKSLDERMGDYWKVDVAMVGRTPMLFLIHEYTLFTLVRKKVDFKTIKDIVQEIRLCCQWYKSDKDITLGKNTNRKLSGSINEIKKVTWFIESPDSINRMEMQINSGLYSYLSENKYGYESPFDTVELYIKGQWPKIDKKL